MMHLESAADLPSRAVSLFATAHYDIDADNGAGAWRPALEMAMTVPGESFGRERHVRSETLVTLPQTHMRESDAAAAAADYAADRLRALFAET